MTSQFVGMTLSSVFWSFFVSLAKFSYWSKFHVDIIADAGAMKVFFYKGLTRNPEIGNTPSEFCPISGDWGKLGIPKLAWMFLTKCFWMQQNSMVVACTVSELSRENQQGRVKLFPHPD